MEYYDVIIVGAGIAGCGLAYNLKGIGYGGKVLVIDKEGIGSNKGYDYRVTEKEIVEEYTLTLVKKFKGVKIGSHEEVYATIDYDKYYFIDYQKSCKSLIKRSQAKFLKTKAKFVKRNKLITVKETLKFKYIIDCSGYSSFLRRSQKKPMPIRYWMGIVNVFEGDTDLDKGYYYNLFGEENSLEDVYFAGEKISYGRWKYTKKIDFRVLENLRDTFLKKHVTNAKIIAERKVAIPNSPIYPLIDKNTALLGDSFGNTCPSSAIGIVPILISSKMLATALKNNNLKQYEIEWKKKYKKSYDIFLISRLDRYLNPPIFKFLKRKYPKNVEMLKLFNQNPHSFIKLVNNDKDTDIRYILDKFPWYRKIFLFYYFIYLKINYILMQISD